MARRTTQLGLPILLLATLVAFTNCQNSGVIKTSLPNVVSFTNDQAYSYVGGPDIDLTKLIKFGIAPYQCKIHGAGLLTACVFTATDPGEAAIDIIDARGIAGTMHIETYEPYTVMNFEGASSIVTVNGANVGAPNFSRADSTATATYFDRKGILQTANVGKPRYDYDPDICADDKEALGGTCDRKYRGLLFESTRTNLLTSSNSFTSAPWQHVGFNPVGGKPNALLSTNTATQISILQGQQNSALSIVVSNLITNSDYTFSIWMQAGNSSLASLGQQLSGATQKTQMGVNLTSYWKRFELTFSTASNTSVTLFIGDDPPGATDSGADFFIFGAQLELGLHATSYIATNGQPVTRQADSASLNPTSWLPPSGVGSWVVDFEITYPMEGQTILAAVNELMQPGIDGIQLIRQIDFNKTAFEVWGVDPSSGCCRLISNFWGLPTWQVPGRRTSAFALADKDASHFENGIFASAAPPPFMPDGISKLFLGSNSSGKGQLNGWLKKASYFKSRISDTALEQLSLGKR